MRKLIFIALLLYGLSVISRGLVFAQDAKSGPAEKLGRGLTNAATGWIEMPVEMSKQVRDKGHFAGLIAGPVTGVFKAIGRTLAGVYEVITFPIPSKPAPGPEYAWQNID